MLTITCTPLSYRVPLEKNGDVIGERINISAYLEHFNHTTWNPKTRSVILLRRYIYYNHHTHMVHIPRYDLHSFCQFLTQHRVAFCCVDAPLQAGLPVSIPLKAWVKDRDPRQTEAITYLVNSPQSMRGVSLGTGIGKSFCMVKATSLIGKRSLICMAGLVDQWKEAYLKFTDLTEDDIYILQGAPSVAKLMQGIDVRFHPKVILCSLGTIRGYVTDDEAYQNFPPFEDFCDHLRIGIKGVDEAHLNFFLNLMLDLRMNMAINIPLTATFDRSDQQLKKMFDQHYPRTIRFGEGAYDRHVAIFSYSYAYPVPRNAYLTPQGYGHNRLEKWFLRHKTKLDYLYGAIYEPLIHAHYINVRKPGQKLLILCERIEMCLWLRNRLRLTLPASENFNIQTYNYGSPESVLIDSDIIVSTPKSAGTGRDIQNLKTMLMTIATGNDTINKQTLGRLRVLKQDTPIYVYIWNREIPKHGEYQEYRRLLFEARGAQYTHTAL